MLCVLVIITGNKKGAAARRQGFLPWSCDGRSRHDVIKIKPARYWSAAAPTPPHTQDTGSLALKEHNYERTATAPYLPFYIHAVRLPTIYDTFKRLNSSGTSCQEDLDSKY